MVPAWFFIVPGQFSCFFTVPGQFSWVFMIPGWFSWFFMGQGWLFMFFFQNIPARTISWPGDPVYVRRPEGGIGPSYMNKHICRVLLPTGLLSRTLYLFRKKKNVKMLQCMSPSWKKSCSLHFFRAIL